MPADARPVMAAIDNEVVPLRLGPDGAVDGLAERFVVGRGPQRLAQIGSVLLAEAGMDRAGAGDPHPVTGLAEIMGHRRDEAERAAGLVDADVARGSPGALVEVGQGELLGEASAYQRQRYILIDAAGADLAHRHHL